MAKELDRFDPNPKKNIKLKTKLIAMIVGATVVGVAIAATVSLTVFDKGLMDQTKVELEHTTAGVEWILQDWLDTLGGYGDMLASTDHIKGYLDGSYTDDANVYLKEKAGLCGVDLLAITDASGKVVSYSEFFTRQVQDRNTFGQVKQYALAKAKYLAVQLRKLKG